jgi:alanyl-tRNA synthetase
MKQPNSNEIRRRFIDFFVEKYAHKEIPSASVVPENDPTVLFTTAGMHPLVPYLMGEPHPQGTRIVDAQKCVRTDDIDEVGDTTHCTFFEMLGNWSLGDYFKDEAINMSYKLLTTPWVDGGYGLAPGRISVSCFEGDDDAPKDEESADIWRKIGIPEERIFFYGKKKNWWGPAGQTGPCGPDSEMFYDTVSHEDPNSHRKGGIASEDKCQPSCDCGRYVEVWNDVFMQYNKQSDGSFEPLQQKNVDTGLGMERITAILQDKESPFETDLFWPAVKIVLDAASISCEGDKLPNKNKSSLRIIADHLRAATFIIGDSFGVFPSNKDQGYILRRLIRRAIRHGRIIGIDKAFIVEVAESFVDIYKDAYPELKENKEKILDALQKEEKKFGRTLDRGIRELRKMIDRKGSEISGKDAFFVFETYGFPFEMIVEELEAAGLTINLASFKENFDGGFKKHQEQSRHGSEQKFSGGLADDSEQCKMHHTATHLVHQALRDVLGDHVFQKGSNITKERLRFDFNHAEKMTPEQVKEVEDIVNRQIERDIPVHYEIMEVDDAKERGAIGVFDDKYAQLDNKVKIYIMGDYSMEVCGGPHVEHTGVLKHFKITKEQASSAGIRRIKAVVEGIKDVVV